METSEKLPAPMEESAMKTKLQEPGVNAGAAKRAPIVKLADVNGEFLTFKAVSQLISIKRGRIYQLMWAGRFPRPLKLPSGGVRWRLSDIRTWITSGE